MIRTWLFALPLFVVSTSHAQVSFRGQTILEDPIAAVKGGFINPNEHENYLHARCLDPRERGVLVSIGSFRGLNLGTFGGFSAIFQLDYDFLVTLFNDLNKEFIRISDGRHEYLSYLFTGTLLKNQIQAAKAKNTLQSDLAFVRELIAIARKTTKEKYYQALATLPLSLRIISEKERTVLKERFHVEPQAFQTQRSPLALQYLFTKLPPPDLFLNRIEYFFLFSETIRRGAFFGDDRLFSRAKTLAENGLIVPLSIDLTGEQGMKSLGGALRQLNLQVKAVDVSNAHAGILEKIESEKEKVGQYFLNLEEALPWSPQGRLLITDEFKRSPIPEARTLMKWKYFAFHRNLLETLALSYFFPVFETSGPPQGLSQWPIRELGAPFQQLGISPSLYSLPASLCR